MPLEQSNKPLVIYHAGCYDGFASAFVAWLYFGEGNVDFYPAMYGSEPPFNKIIEASDVYIIDFSYSEQYMVRIHEKLRGHLVVLDHHKTAKEALNSFRVDYIKCAQCHIEFDMNRSGVGMAWDYFFPTGGFIFAKTFSKGRPWLISYIQDRDLWKFDLTRSKEVNAYISTLPFDFHTWETELFERHISDVVRYGEVILRKTESYNEEMMKAYMWRGDWWIGLTVYSDKDFSPSVEIFKNVPIINAPHVGISELLNYIIEKTGAPIAVGFRYNNNGIWTYSLRSAGQVDVSDIAKQYGGGGHHNAAGFELDHLIFKVPSK